MENKLMWSFIIVVITIGYVGIIEIVHTAHALNRAKTEIIEQCSK